MSPMIEVSGGMNSELTGTENVSLLGALLGRDTHEMKDRAHAIAEWAGLAEFMDVPVRSYSTGMRARLAFAIATDRKPDILLVDEVLSVGDEQFRQKSMARIDELMAGGTTVILVSHALATVSKYCERVMWLDRGLVKMEGPATEVVEAYKASV
jgi:ABC-type polysaccharide/polyol phosphate transport system ATPase subunit